MVKFMIPSLNWVWYWRDETGKIHMTRDCDEVEVVIHSHFGLTVWAERIPESGGVMIK